MATQQPFGGVDQMTAVVVAAAYARQSRLIDSGEARGWAATFTADGVFDSPSYPEPVIGTEALERFAREYADRARATGVVMRHVVSNLEALAGPDPARLMVLGYLQIVATPRGKDSRLVRFTTIEDDLVRDERAPSGWLIARRVVRRDDAGPEVVLRVGHRPALSFPNHTTAAPEDQEIAPHMSTVTSPAARSALNGSDHPGRVQGAPMEVVHPDLAGKVAVVTGAGRGMGARFAAALGRRGVHVVGADIDSELMSGTASALAEEIEQVAGAGEIVGTTVDVRDREAQQRLAELAVQRFGQIDLWINNAGIFPEAPAADIPVSQMQATLSINVEGVLYGAQAAASVMKPGSAIVNMASVAAVRVRRGRAAYCSSKAAVAHLTECLAVEFGDLGIRVNAIAPGFVDTEMTRWVQDDPEALARALDSVPLHRLGSPEEIVGPMLFLLSESARYVTGHILAVDAGSRHV
ncbi:SDR family oxidoreductase [Nocardioides sp. DS6]|uniref:SDR family oxidoreductase n=1 Tax=Nocardioides eburneus TaxID=3231482 RepID=A0ABV3SWS3_9ACTN